MKYRNYVLGLLFSLALVLATSCVLMNAQSKQSVSGNSNIESKITALMSKMTLTDKVGEMTQLSIDVLSVGEPYNLKKPHEFDEAKLRKVLVDLKVGSILNVGGHAYTLDHWHKVIKTIQDIATKEKESGIPVLYGIDAIHGTNYTVGSTLFPQQIGLAATWNTDLGVQMGRITAYETRASWIPWNFSPVLDMGRDPRWSRLWETFGEDVHLAAAMGEAVVKGYQGDDVSDPESVAACMKHFLGYGTPHSGKDRTVAYIPERQLLEYHVPTFQRAIDTGAKTLMICSGELNGVPVHASKAILTDLLRGKLGFKGLAVSDWEDILYLVSRHKVAKNHKDAIKMSINAGVDMSMVPMDTQFPVLLKELVEEGEVPMSRIDESVRRILRVKYELGLFENPYHENHDYSKFASAEHTQASLQAAQESITLLKNEDNILPLGKNQTVLVTGPTANSMRSLNGGWTGTWQGDDEAYFTKGKSTLLKAIQNEIGAGKVKYVEGTSYDKAINIQKAAQAAKSAKVAIVCLGELSYTEKPGDLDDLTLPQAQADLIAAIKKTGTPIVLVLLEGRPRIITDFESDAQATVLGYHPGDEGGVAIADVLFGDINPSGKLPYTYPRHVNSLLTYDHKWTDRFSRDFSFNDFKPLYEFGYGLSYTSFKYTDLKVSSKEFTADGNIDISVKLSNTGSRAGKEVVQLFIADKVATITPSHKRLRGFEKIALAPNESKTVTFSIEAKDLAFVGMDNEWITEAGEFEIQIADLKTIVELKDKLQ